MNISLRECKPPVDESRISEVENRFGIELPHEYREFLLRHNGGRPSPNRFHYKYETGPYTDSLVDWFLAIYDGEFNNFEDYFDTFKICQVRMPKELVPIAHDPGGNQICIAVSGKNRGAVYFWDHENESPGRRPWYKNVHLIADSFNEFLDGLT